MSNTTELNILLKPNSNKNNKKILEYLHNKQEKINDNDIIINPIVLESDKINDFVKMGVSNLPSLLYNDDIVYGVSKITKYIDNLCMNTTISKPKQSTQQVENSGDDDLNEYMLSLAFEEDDELEQKISDKEIKKKVDTFNYGSSNNTRNTKHTEQKITNDDHIMSKYLENLEETL